MSDLVNISIGNAAIVALLGYAVVFVGLILLMIVVIAQGKIMVGLAARNAKKQAAGTGAAAAVSEIKEAAVETVSAPEAPGSAGEIKLYDTDPRDAAMIMAIVADTLKKPVNELRFKSIREVREDEV